MSRQSTRTTWPDRDILAEPRLDYRVQWRAYALRRYTALFFLFTWPPVAVVLFEVSRNGLHQPVICGTLILLWFAIAIAAVWWAGEFRCPRCRRRYGALGSKRGRINLTRGLFDRACANCKLTKFEQAQQE